MIYFSGKEFEVVGENCLNKSRIMKMITILFVGGNYYMKTIISIFISYIALYLVIYLHEVGHALLYHRYGCKERWYKVTVKPYLFFSTPLPIDTGKARLLSKKQHVFISSAGVIVNLLFAIISLLILYSLNPNYYINLFLYQFSSLHLGEAISYLVVGNIYLVSDMETIAMLKPILRPFGFIFGLFALVMYTLLIIHIPEEYKLIVILYNIISILCMCIGRIAFTIIHKRRIRVLK